MAVNIFLKRSATPSKRPVGGSMAYGELNLNYDASTGGLYYKNNNGNVVKVGPCQVSSTAPNSAPGGSSGNSAGEFWFDTSTQTLKLYDGTTWVEAGGMVQGITGTAPITVDNTDPLNPIVGISTGTTSARGAVQLTDSTSSTSTTTAATPNSVKSAYDLAAAALPKAGGTMTGDITFHAGQVFPGVVTSVTAVGGSAISVDNTDPTQPVLSVASASTTSSGVVQLNDTTSSSSTTEALTANQGRVLQTQIDALIVSNNLTFAGTIDASTGDMLTVSTEGSTHGFAIGDPLPSPAAGNSEFFVIVTVPGTMTPPGGVATDCHQGDWWLSDGTDWNFLDVGYNAPYATTTTPGIVQLATDAEVQAGSNLDHAVTPAGLQSKVSNSTSTTSSTTLASSTAVKSAYDAGIQGQTDAAAAQATADAALPKAGGTMTGNITFQDAGEGIVFNDASEQVGISDSVSQTASNIAASSSAVKAAYDLADAAIPDSSFVNAGDLLVGTGAGTYTNLPAGDKDTILSSDGDGNLVWVDNSKGDVTSVSGTSPITVDNTNPQTPVVGINAASTTASGAVQLNDTVTSTSTTQAATANAAKTAYDAATAAQSTANAALPKAGGTMTGNITFQDAGEGVVFSDSSTIAAISNSTSTTSSTTAASSTAVKSAYDLANAALPKAGGTMTGDITFSGAGNGINFQDGSIVEAISNSVATTSSITAASSTAVKTAYDAAIAAQAAAPLASATTLFVNVTTGNNTTAARGTAKPYATITAALAAASEGDTIFVAPGTYTESVTLSKGVNLVGTFTDQAISSGPKIVGTFTVSITGAGTRNWAVANFQMVAASAGNNTAVVSNNSFGSGGLGSFTNCFFQQFTSASTTEQCFATSGTWTRSLYLRNCTFDGNFTHNAGTTAGASGYVVIDNLLGIANAAQYYKVATGTCEFRNPSNALAPVIQTGGFAVFSNVLSWQSNLAATTAIFGGTGFAYKGTSAGLGQCVVYFTGQGCNVVEGSTWGKISVGSNVVYAMGNVNYDTSLATLSGIPLTTAAPNPNGVLSTMARPQWTYLTTSSSVTAANQLGVVLDSTNGNVYTVTAYDAGTY